MEEKLYRRINNPLNNDTIIKDVLYEYIYGDNMFNGLMRNKTRKNTSQSFIFHDLLFKNNYDDWKKYIDELYASLAVDDLIYNDIKTIHDFLNKYLVKKYNDVKIVLDEGYKTLEDLFIKYCPIKNDEDFNIINTTGNNSFDHGLCINCDLNKLHFIVYKFYEKCKEKNLNYCIKFNESGFRKDSIIVYSNSEDFPIYLKILEDILKESDLSNYINELPVFISQISDGIGYVSSKDDFFKRRARYIEYCIERETINWINKYFDKDVKTFIGRIVPYKYYVFNKIVVSKKNQLKDSFREEKINYREFKKALIDSLIRNHDSIFKAILNRDFDYSLKVRYKNKVIEFTYNDFANIFKDQAYFFKSQPGYEDAIIERIKNTSTFWDIDQTDYGMDIGDSYILGKEANAPRGKVTIEMLNNFADNKRTIRSSREGRILDKNIEKRSIFSKRKK